MFHLYINTVGRENEEGEIKVFSQLASMGTRMDSEGIQEGK